ncbi:MAG: PIG-L family deacetylase [Chitinophagaceae bacterium]
MRIIKLIIVFAMCCLTSVNSVNGQTKSRTILSVFPHPDDENMIGSVLAKYARLGHKVYVIIATDGKDGTRVTKIPPGDSLGGLRQKETICACEKLGINPPIYLHIDRLDTKFGVRPYLNGRKKMMEELKIYIQKLNPDILITFGPDGEYGHSEHIVTGALLTELLLREGWVDKYPLYFPADIEENVADGGVINGFVDKQYLNLKLNYSDEDEQKSLEAAKCYITQNTIEEIKELIETVTKDKSNTKYFRRFYVVKGTKNEFWD